MQATENHFYSLLALTDVDSTITTFDNALTVTISYTDNEISGLVETSLLIYRWDESSWNSLNNCSVDTSANSVTCETSNFSTFGLFGQAESSDNDNSSSSITGGGSFTPISSIGNGISNKSIPMYQKRNIGELNNSGINILMYIESTAEFYVKVSQTNLIQQDSLKITDLNTINTKIVIGFHTHSKTYTLIEDSNLEIDLNDDQVNDISLYYNNLLVNQIDLTIKQLEFEKINLEIPVGTDNNENLEQQEQGNEIPDPDMEEILVLNEGSLVKGLDGPAVYLIQNNKKRPFYNEQSFLSNNYSWDEVLEVSDLSSIETGEIIQAESIKVINDTNLSNNDKYVFKYNLAYGTLAADVIQLQIFLNSNGYIVAEKGRGSLGNEIEYFGQQTQDALINFQKDNNITPAIGFFGPVTRNFINQL